MIVWNLLYKMIIVVLEKNIIFCEMCLIFNNKKVIFFLESVLNFKKLVIDMNYK